MEGADESTELWRHPRGEKMEIEFSRYNGSTHHRDPDIGEADEDQGHEVLHEAEGEHVPENIENSDRYKNEYSSG